jgi:hypothetical protein
MLPVSITISNLEYLAVAVISDFMQLPILEPHWGIVILCPFRNDQPPTPRHLSNVQSNQITSLAGILGKPHTIHGLISDRYATTTWRYQIDKYGFPYRWNQSFP